MTQTGQKAALHPSRNNWVDMTKGLCIILVVMLHSVEGVEAQMGQLGWMAPILDFAAPFRMPAFFIIAGLFLSRTIDRPWPHYIDKKIVHFVYFYVLWLTIQYGFKGSAIALNEGIAMAIGHYLYGFVQPFGTLWFIYLLPLFFLAARWLKNMPVLWVLAAAALLEIAPIHTGWLVADEFAARFVYFYAGYAFASRFFAFAAWAEANRAKAAGMAAAIFLLNFIMVFAPVTLDIVPEIKSHIDGQMVVARLADLPVISLLLGALGSFALIATAVLLAVQKIFKPLLWAGANSIVIYLAFFLPMIIARVVLIKTGIITDVGTISLLTWLAAVAGPLVFYGLVRKTGLGLFLFERPQWAQLKVQNATKA